MYNYFIRAKVVLQVYNLVGEKVFELVNEYQKAGSYSFNFDALNMSSGYYFYTITSGNHRETKKMLLIK